MIRISAGFALAGTGDPTSDKAPLPESMEKTATSLVKLLVTNKYLPEGSMTAAFGLEPPAGVGIPLSAKVPSLATLKMEIVLAKEFTAYRNFFEGSNAMPVGEVSCTCGVSAPRVMAPVAPLMCSRSTEPLDGRVTYALWFGPDVL